MKKAQVWMLLSGVYFAGKLYGVVVTRFAPVLLDKRGRDDADPARPVVEDSATGKDPYRAFAMRFSLYVAVTLYAWVAIVAPERLRAARASRIKESEVAV